MDSHSTPEKPGAAIFSEDSLSQERFFDVISTEICNPSPTLAATAFEEVLGANMCLIVGAVPGPCIEF